MSLAFSNTVVTQISDFEHAVAQIPDSRLLNAAGLVLRVDAELWLRLTSGSITDPAIQAQAAAVMRRAPGQDVFVIPDGHSCAEARPSYAARHGPHRLIDGSRASASFDVVEPSRFLEIQQQDLTGLLEAGRSRCVICATSNYHFELPSGAHASQFVRLAEAFVDIETVDRIAYWIALGIQSRIPLLADNKNHALLVDHPSMLVLASRVQRLVSIRLEVVAFPSYPSDVENRTASFDLLRRVASRSTAVFVLVGIASTGRLANFIERWADQETSGTEVKASILYAIREIAGANILCRLELPDYQHFEKAEDCQLCSSQSSPVRIQNSNYMVGHAHASAVPLPTSLFDEQRPFIERWGKHPGVLRVHYPDPNESTARHHAFYVDVGTLLDIAEFNDEVLRAAQTFEPQPDLIVIPDHPTAIRIGRFISTALSIELAVLSSSLLAKGEGEANASLRSAACILVVDDVFITGSRFDGINRFLRENRALRAPNLVHIHYWTLLATPASSTRYRQVVTGMTTKHRWAAGITHLYKFALPDWHEAKSCPWCREMNVLSGLAQSTGDLEGPLVDRLSELSSTAGMSESTWTFRSGKKALPPKLGAESATLSEGADSLQVLFTCASAVQQLRDAAQRRLDPDQFPTPAYLAQRVFSANYTERLIWLGLLRSLKGKELEPNLKDFLSSIALTEAESQIEMIRGELGVAWITGKLDAIKVSKISERFFDSLGISWQALFNSGLVDGDPPEQ